MNNTEKSDRLPRITYSLLCLLVPEQDRSFLMGDYQEIFGRTVRQHGRFIALLMIWFQIVKAVPLFTFDSCKWSMIMLANYIKIALRNIVKYKGFSLINISGLAVGVASCLLILLYVADELSYDRHQEKRDRIFRIISHSTIGGTTRHFAPSPPKLSEEVSKSVPGVEDFARLFPFNNTVLVKDDIETNIGRMMLVDSSYFNLFSHTFIDGSPENALSKPNSIILTRSVADRIFGDHDPMDQLLTVRNFRFENVQVTGIIEDVPRNSHFRFDVLVPVKSIPHYGDGRMAFLDEDYSFFGYAYLLLNENSSPAVVRNDMMGLVESRWGGMLKDRGVMRDYELQSMNDIYLRSNYESEIGQLGNINYVILFSVIALFVLFIACFNFINLSTARSANRAKEVGLRKVFGAFRTQIMRQFLCEAVLLSLFSILFGLILVVLVLPYFNTLSGKSFVWQDLVNTTLLTGVFVTMLLTGFAAGSVPAFIFSGFESIKIIRGKFSSSTKGILLRKSLVVLQFSISVFMIASTIMVVQQLDYLKNKNLGFDREQLVVVRTAGQQNEALRQKLEQNSDIVSFSFSSSVPGMYTGDVTFAPEGKEQDETIRLSAFRIGYNYTETYGMDILYGRDFDPAFPTDTLNAVILNEKALQDLGWREDAIGKELTFVSSNNEKKTVIGVVKDFHHKKLDQEINPTIIFLDARFNSFITARLRPVKINESIQFIETAYREQYPEREFNYYFIDDDFRMKYAAEEHVRDIYFNFGILAILIASLGLYGLSAFSAEQRRKEVGIRKVMGATNANIILLLSRDYIKFVLLSVLVATPAAWYFADSWLRNFAYRIDVELTVFLLAGLVVVLVAFLTTAKQAFFSARANPADSIRHE